jgi:hypothetical protein
MNLMDIYKSILDKPDKWQYYKKVTAKSDIFTHENAARDFIKNYFGTGGKGTIFEGLPGLDRNRILHTISIFFLGIHLSKLIFKGMLPHRRFKPAFLYHWYLASLFHDYGYVIENNKEYYNPQKHLQLSSLKERGVLNIEHDALENLSSSKFSQKLVEDYYHYCAKEKCFINHGIVGGLYLYDRLVKNTDYQFEQYQTNGGTCTREKFVHNGLKWGAYQHSYFSKVATAVIYHNIWFCTEDIIRCTKTEGKVNCKKTYVDYRLQALIMDKNCKSRHSLSTDPLLFLLILSDTLEPLKQFNTLKPECLLEMIRIVPDEEKKEIKIEVIDECLEFEPWFHKIYDLETWTKLKVNAGGQNELIISDF